MQAEERNRERARQKEREMETLAKLLMANNIEAAQEKLGECGEDVLESAI